MARKLRFAHRFSNGVVGTIAADLRKVRKCGQFAAMPAFSGGKAPPEEVERWMTEIIMTLADRVKRRIACIGPSGALWVFGRSQRSELVGAYMSKLAAMAFAMETKIGIATDHAFSNGSRAVVAIDFSKEPTHVAITLFGEKPDSQEAEAWLVPMLRCGEHYGVAGVEEELARVGLLWWRVPKSTGAQGANGHVRDLFAFEFTHQNGGAAQ